LESLAFEEEAAAKNARIEQEAEQILQITDTDTVQICRLGGYTENNSCERAVKPKSVGISN